ncbi:MAG: hypothetical protein JWQ75_3655 [Pseudarthrobacter sp.]|nr:hypothetical protein [Pseudarthrobacter sp.]
MSDSKLTPPRGDAAMSVRECRLILERLLVAAGLGPGEVPAARDALLAAEIHGLGLLEYIHAEPLTIPAQPVTYTETGSEIFVDGAGRLAALLIPALRDIILERGTVRILIRNVDAPQLIGALESVPELDSSRLTVDVTSAESAAIAASPGDSAQQRDAREQRITNAHLNGLPVPGVVWLDLYQRSNAALHTESAKTRSHAGYKDVDETGRIVKQMDDDVDIDFALNQAAV